MTIKQFKIIRELETEKKSESVDESRV